MDDNHIQNFNTKTESHPVAVPIMHTNNSTHDYLNPMMKKEIFETIDKIYFHDFDASPAYETFKCTSDYELHKQLELISAAQSMIDDTGSSTTTTSGVVSAGEDDNSNTSSDAIQKKNMISFNKILIKNRAKKLQIEQDVVCRKVSDIILENSKAFSVELQRVSEFKFILEDSYQICSIARRSLFMSEYSFLMPTLKLVKKQMKKSNLIKLLNTVNEIKYFNDSINQIIDLTQNKEWPSAINLCFKIEKEISKYQNLTCIKGLKKKTNDSYLLIEESLSESLSKLIIINSNTDILNGSLQQDPPYFDDSLFGKIFTAYFKLNKLAQFFDKLNSYLIQSINFQLQQTIIYTLIYNKISNQQPNEQLLSNKEISIYLDEIKRKDMHELFKLINVDDYKKVISELCLNLWTIMKNYYRICVWICGNYLNNDSSANVNKIDDITLMNMIEKKLNSGLHLVWKEVQQRTSQLFRSMCFEHFKFDEFIQILTILHKLVEFGNEFCNNLSQAPEVTSKILLSAVKDQTLAYFRAIHILHLEELKMFLENEIWQWCPVQSNFSIFNLHEYKFLKETQITTIKTFNGINGHGIEKKTTPATTPTSNVPFKFDINPKMIDFLNSESTNPFLPELIPSSPSEQSITNGSNEERYAEDETNPVNDENAPIVTNTTLNIIRLFGKYIHMLSIFQIISNQVIDYLIQLYNFYFYYIYLDFAHEELEKITSTMNNSYANNNNNDNNNNSHMYTYLQTIIKNIKNDLFVNSKYNISEPNIQSIKAPRNRDDYICCINQRIVAVESLIFLTNQLENLFPLIEKFLPSSTNSEYVVNKHLEYSKILSEITTKIKSPIYLYVARYAIDYNLILDSITKINWDLDEILSQHNAYVDVLLRQIKQFQQDIESLKEQSLLPLNKKIVNSLLGETLKLVMKILVDGYSSVKKCSNEGRALMQLDFQQLVVKLEQMCGAELRPLPNKEFVEAYIKAYYLPDSSIEKWIKDHPDYQQKHIAGLLSSMAQVTKKTRLNINSFMFSSNKENNKENNNNSLIVN